MFKIATSPLRLTFKIPNGEAATDDDENAPQQIILDTNLFEGMNTDQFNFDTSVESIQIFVTGDLAFYAQVLGKPSTASFWCIWCDQHKSLFGRSDTSPGTPWTLQNLKEALTIHANRKARSKKTHLGVSVAPLFDCIEVEDFITSLLHIHMGFVNKSSQNLCIWNAMKVEVLPEEVSNARHEFYRTADILKQSQLRL
jgi:hypothetical protein